MELRHRPLNASRTCASCTDRGIEKSDDSTKKKLLEDAIKENENSVFRSRVFSEANQKENPTPVATLIVGSVAICCSGLFMLWGEYEKNK
jgi:hypothetical protein